MLTMSWERIISEDNELGGKGTTYIRGQRLPVIANKRIERALKRQPRVPRHARGGALSINRVGTGVVLVLLLDNELVGLSMSVLPSPEHPVDEGMMKEEDWIEARRVILGHVTVRTRDHTGVLGRDLDASDSKMHLVMRRLDRHDGLATIVLVVIPLLGGASVAKDEVVRCIQGLEIALSRTGSQRLGLLPLIVANWVARLIL